MAWKIQNQATIPPKQATSKVSKMTTSKANPTQYRSVAPLYLDKDIADMCKPSV